MEQKIEITSIAVHVPVGMSLGTAFTQAKEMACKFGCEVEIPDFNGEKYIVTYYTDVEAEVSEYFNKYAGKLGL